MLTKKEILLLVEKIKPADGVKNEVEMILRNFAENDLVPTEKLEVICKLLIEE